MGMSIMGFMGRRMALAAGLAGVTCLAGSGYAQTVTVDPTGAANGTTIFTNLQDAVASFATGGSNVGNVAANVINVRSDHGPVTGSMVADTAAAAPIRLIISDAITIKGVDAGGADTMAVFAGTALPNEQQVVRNGAFPAFVWRQPADLTVRNIAFIPASPGSGPEMRSFMVLKSPVAPAHEPVVNIEDCVFTSNNGSNQPITTTGRPEDDSKLSEGGVISMASGSAGIWSLSEAAGAGITLNVTDSVFASFSPLTGSNPRAEAFKTWMTGLDTNIINAFLNINEGCVFANIDGNVAQVSWAAMIKMNGTADNPIIVRNLQNSGSPAVVWLYYEPADVQPCAGEFNYVRFYDCIPPVISEGGIIGDGSRAFVNSVTNTIIANTGDGLALRSGTDFDSTGKGLPQVTVNNVVMHNSGTGASAPAGIYSEATAARPVNITNSIFTDNSAKYGLWNGSSAVWTVTNTTLSTTGANPLLAATGGSGTINTDGTVTNQEVTYVNMDDPFSPDFFKVVQSQVNDWAIY